MDARRGDSPESHVRLDVQKLLEADAPWPSGGRFKHEATELGMEDGHRVGASQLLVSRSVAVVTSPDQGRY